jgi:hypothetical protein
LLAVDRAEALGVVYAARTGAEPETVVRSTHSTSGGVGPVSHSYLISIAVSTTRG